VGVGRGGYKRDVAENAQHSLLTSFVSSLTIFSQRLESLKIQVSVLTYDSKTQKSMPISDSLETLQKVLCR
jgi:hypothetical protein